MSGGDSGNEATAVGSNEGRATGSSVELTDTTGPGVVVVCGCMALELHVPSLGVDGSTVLVAVSLGRSSSFSSATSCTQQEIQHMHTTTIN